MELICVWIIVPTLCAVGLVGNVMSLMVFASRLRDGVETVEKGSLAGMMALAISDFFFCATTIIHVYLRDDSLIHRSWSFSLFVTMYASYFQNIFLKVSTYITVVMAVYRYFALVYPIRACKYMSHIIKCTLLAVVVGCIFWILFLLPLIWTFVTKDIDCGGGKSFTLMTPGPYMNRNSLLYQFFTYSYTIVGFLVPMCILLYCNTGIILSLHRSRRKARARTQCYSFQSQRQNRQRGTSITLVCIVLCFCVLVSPSESAHFYLNIVVNHTHEWRVVVIIFNVLLTVNMSFNFALYCIVNSQFRKSIPLLYCAVNDHIRKMSRALCNVCYSSKKDRGTYSLQSVTGATVECKLEISK